MKRSLRQFFIYAFFVTGYLFYGCSTSRPAGRNGRGESQRTHLPYDDSVLRVRQSPVLMPYNRLLDPAGETIRFGDPTLENHSLDAVLLPGGQFLAVEDRYGIAVIDLRTRQVADRYSFPDDPAYKRMMSSFSGIKAIDWQGHTYIFWSCAGGGRPDSYVMECRWDGAHIRVEQAIPFEAEFPAAVALPNDLALREENGQLYLYVVLNGNSRLAKLRVADRKVLWTAPTGVAPYGLTIVGDLAYVTNWAGPVPSDTSRLETAGVPWASAYTSPVTGATAMGTVSVMDLATGETRKEIRVGLHPNAIIHSPDGQYLYVANGNSDEVSVISTATREVVDSISVRLNPGPGSYIGSTPNALALDSSGNTLYVANGMDNAIAVVGKSEEASGKITYRVKGFIPTEAYPGGIVYNGRELYVTNLEAIGPRVNSNTILAQKPAAREVPDVPGGAYNSHHDLASLSFIPLPDKAGLAAYTEKVKKLSLSFREALSRQLPRPGRKPVPLPERIGEPSVFKHVVYIIKENRTYDQVLGDMPEGSGNPSLCVFGDSVTPNEHRLATDFCLLDNYYASGKCSAEGHQWTDAAIVTDYIEKNVRAWFRSYPHAQYDALVYDQEGFIWNNALDHGKTVRIYGEACRTKIADTLDWAKIYRLYREHLPFPCQNITTISRVRPILSQSYPGYDDPRITDQLRAEAFIKDLKDYEKQPGDQWPQLMVMSLPNDHTTGMRPGYPMPRAMVADNDLALGKIIEAITHSRFWDSTVVFVTEDDSQAGWDHVSAYRTTGFVISPYSRSQSVIHTNYNQTSLVRTIEQVLGIPPMNILDASALPMFDCFTQKRDTAFVYTHVPNRIPLDEMNLPLSRLSGKALHFARLSLENPFDHIDQGDDALFNRILWYATRGAAKYPRKWVGKDADD